MNYIIILISKIMQKVLHVIGKGSTFPGDLALKLNRNILSYFKMPKTVIFVTGTAGKTSVSTYLSKIYLNAGYKVGYNAKGANLLGGITTTLISASKINGKCKADVLVFEVDERYVKVISKYITPNYLVITNLSRDQLARNGHHELVFDDINKAIKADTTLVLNADDPLVMQFSLNKKNNVIYYGVSKNSYSTDKNMMNTLDVAYCPLCNAKLKFDYFNYGNLGKYSCPKCEFERPTPLYEANIMDDYIEIENSKINIYNNSLYNIYNILVSYSLTMHNGVNEELIIKTLSDSHIQGKRLDTFKYKGINSTILLSKNETPISYNQTLEYINKHDNDKTIVIGFTRISGRYNLMDTSWLYDINFELLNGDDIKTIILVGPYAYDLSVRLELAGIDKDKIKIMDDIETSFDKCYEMAAKGTDLYFVVYFDLFYKYTDILKKRGINI